MRTKSLEPSRDFSALRMLCKSYNTGGPQLSARLSTLWFVTCPSPVLPLLPLPLPHLIHTHTHTHTLKSHKTAVEENLPIVFGAQFVQN